jgi:uncharacterized flavoprotein (TIGR03862 family)
LSAASHVAVIGGGPAGLIAAEHLAQAGHHVVVHDRMRVVGRKFLLAGRGGLNLTHAEPLELFLPRYGAAASFMRPLIEAFPPDAVREWSHSLGVPTFVGSTQRVFPESFQATTLLRAWLNRLRELGVSFERSSLVDVGPGVLEAIGETELATTYTYDAIVLALGGASWPRLGADGSWIGALVNAGVSVRPFEAANCGVDIDWSPYILERFTGAPMKNVAVSVGFAPPIRGEMVLTKEGLEGGPIYALGPQLRTGKHSSGGHPRVPPTLRIDLRPDVASDALHARLRSYDAKVSITNRLKKVGLDATGCALVREFAPKAKSPGELAAAIKGLTVPIIGLQGLDRAISSSGGVALDEVDEHLMLSKMPGVFVAGEMLDWDAPTGGYLLQACFSTGVVAARGASHWLAQTERSVTPD